MHVQIICNGLNFSTRQLIDAAEDGSLSNKFLDEGEQLLEPMASNESHWASKGTSQKGVGIYEVSNSDALTVKVDV